MVVVMVYQCSKGTTVDKFEVWKWQTFSNIIGDYIKLHNYDDDGKRQVYYQSQVNKLIWY